MTIKTVEAGHIGKLVFKGQCYHCGGVFTCHAEDLEIKNDSGEGQRGYGIKYISCPTKNCINDVIMREIGKF